MRLNRKSIGGSVAAIALYHVLIGWGPAQAENPAQPAPLHPGPVSYDPLRQAYFGDLHLHTAFSLDAYVAVGTRTTPEEAFKFARGEEINYLGQPIRNTEPYDFLAVCDHSENMGVFNQIDDPSSAFSLSEMGRMARAGGIENALKIMKMAVDGISLGANAKQVTASTWQRSIAAANANYVPGRFTAFICYEWTSTPGGNNMHRNVVFRGDKAPLPFTALDSTRPEDLWAWLGQQRANGYQVLAIPHNSNASNGDMFDWNKSDGTPIDRAYALQRSENEPLLEVTQMKGTSETHPLLSPNDEFAGFEIYDKLLDQQHPSKPQGSYWRDGLGRGLVIGARVGVNPFKLGAVGGSDLHSGISISREQDFGGERGNVNLGGGRFSGAQAEHMLEAKGPYSVILQGSPGLTGVWAEANTREAIFDALRRKETFATSGTRIRVRLFGSWNYPADLPRHKDWIKAAYAGGVPMGGDLPARQKGVPTFMVQAVKDPESGNLDRIQIVKVWLDNGEHKEQVFDVAWSGQRRMDPRTGKVGDVGSTVDLTTGRYTNDIGAAELFAVWKDPAFQPWQPAVYYARVIEIPTPRWTTLRALEHHLPLSSQVPATIQERAWSSPIWYAPAANRGLKGFGY